MTGESPHAKARVHVEQIRLHRFRVWHEATIELGPGLTLVSGRNAQGKTSLLEAIGTVALSRSPRGATADELIAWGEPVARVTARIRRPPGVTELDMRLERVAGAERASRRTLVDGTPRPARELLGVCPVVLFQPEDLLLVKGGPDSRRRLLDVLLSQLDPRLAAELVRYRHALDQRNALLRQIRAGRAGTQTLDVFTTELARAGGVVRVARAALTAALVPLAAAALSELSDARERLSLRYTAGSDDDQSWYGADDGPVAERDGSGTEALVDADAAAHSLESELQRRRAEECARGMTVAGPHRDNLQILLDGRPARAAASQGQQRSAVLALKLAEVRHLAQAAGLAPILLLDDVLSELDDGRRSRLLAGLGAGSRSQALLTTAELAPLSLDWAGPVRHLRIERGAVAERHDGSTASATPVVAMEAP